MVLLLVLMPSVPSSDEGDFRDESVGDAEGGDAEPAGVPSKLLL